MRAIRIDNLTWRIERAPIRRRPPVRRRSQPLLSPERGVTSEIIVAASKRDVPRDTYPGAVDIVSPSAFGPAGTINGTEALIARFPTLGSTELGPGRNKLFIRGVADSSFNGPTQATTGQSSAAYADLSDDPPGSWKTQAGRLWCVMPFGSSDGERMRRGPSPEPGQAIALLVNVLSGGGAQRRIATLANRFAGLGRQVDVVSVDPDGPMRAMLAPSVRVVTLVPSGATRRITCAVHARRLAAYLADVHPAVMMSCVTDVHLLAVVANSLHRGSVPLVLRASRHPYRPIDRRSWLKRAIEPFNLAKAAWCYRRADAIISLTEDGADGLRRLLGNRPKRLETIPNPIVSSTLLDEPTTDFARYRNPVPVILGVGRLVEQKDFGTLLRAFAKLRSQRAVRLVLLGEGKQARDLWALAQRLGIAQDVEMPGEVDDVADRMRHADLVVSSSLWEGLQGTLVEALAVGCPVVATDCPGGSRETLEDGRLGPLVPVRDPERLAIAMAAQLDHPSDPRVLAAGAARFTFAGKAERYLALFDSLQVAPPG